VSFLDARAEGGATVDAGSSRTAGQHAGSDGTDEPARTEADQTGQPAEEGRTGERRTVSGASVRTLWRRNRVAACVLLGVVLIATVIGFAQQRGAGGRLAPRSAQPDGGRALAALLEERGVSVERTTDPAALGAGASTGTALLIALPGLLGDEGARSVGDLSTGTVVLVSPTAEIIELITDDIRAESVISVQVRRPGCSEPAAEAAGSAVIGGRTFSTDGGASCYREDGDYAPLVTGRTHGGARLVVIGTGQPLTNQRLDEEGNAALALNLLGADGSASELRWLVPAPGAGSREDTLSSILPDWVVPALLQLALAGVLLALWRGRRLGPPVVEPLPVVVRAAEAVEGRARLYRRAQARDRAAEALRSGALARLVPRLGIDPPAGGEPPAEAVVAAVASRSGRPDAEVHAVFFGPPPADDAGLVRLTETLDAMVRSTLDPEGPHS
jgi:hypothetical protein